jgi:hypothetical protein
VPIGGNSPVDQVQREHRYIQNLRGPVGETPVLKRLGSSMLPGAPDNRKVLLDSYSVSVPSRTVTIYLNLTDFATPQAPAGFTCAQPIGIALGPPPIDGNALIRQTWDFVPKHYQRRELPPISLDSDGSSRHGVVFDNFRALFLRARATNGEIGPPAPSPASATPLFVVAFPRDCNGTPVLAERIEIGPKGGPVLPRVGHYGHSAQLAKSLPGATFPENSVGALFSGLGASFRAGDTVRIRYASSDCPTETEVQLPVAYEPAKLILSPLPILPPGVTEVEPSVFLQVLGKQ